MAADASVDGFEGVAANTPVDFKGIAANASVGMDVSTDRSKLVLLMGTFFLGAVVLLTMASMIVSPEVSTPNDPAKAKARLLLLMPSVLVDIVLCWKALRKMNEGIIFRRKQALE